MSHNTTCSVSQQAACTLLLMALKLRISRGLNCKTSPKQPQSEIAREAPRLSIAVLVHLVELEQCMAA